MNLIIIYIYSVPINLKRERKKTVSKNCWINNSRNIDYQTYFSNYCDKRVCDIHNNQIHHREFVLLCDILILVFFLQTSLPSLLVRLWTIKLLEENIGRKLSLTGFGSDFLHMIPKAQVTKANVYRWNCIKLKCLCIAKENEDSLHHERKYFKPST